MAQEILAIYENGVLRPLIPLNLPEQTEVAVTVHTANGAAQASSISLLQQQNVLDEMFCEVDALPQVPATDQLSGRDHDQILYGSAK